MAEIALMVKSKAFALEVIRSCRVLLTRKEERVSPQNCILP